MDYDQAMFLFGGCGRVIRNMQPMPGVPKSEDNEQESNEQNNNQQDGQATND